MSCKREYHTPPTAAPGLRLLWWEGRTLSAVKREANLCPVAGRSMKVGRRIRRKSITFSLLKKFSLTGTLEWGYLCSKCFSCSYAHLHYSVHHAEAMGCTDELATRSYVQDTWTAILKGPSYFCPTLQYSFTIRSIIIKLSHKTFIKKSKRTYFMLYIL